MTQDVKISIGDVRDELAKLADDSVDCVVTSPPYWGLRDYGVEGQLGLEPTPDAHLAVMVGEVFAEVHRVLKPEGTCFVNYGDCYAAKPNGRAAKDVARDDRAFHDKPFSTVVGNLKPKDLVMMPNRFAIAMHDAGWWVRSEIIWAKPNPMPESVTDRPATAHEKIFLFTKSKKSWWDAQAVRRSPAENRVKTSRAKSPSCDVRQRGAGRPHAGFNDKWDGMSRAEQQANGRNLRNYEPALFDVWEMATRPFSGAHFATFPEELARRCIVAGCPVGGLVLDPFGGAGTTGLAARNTMRRAHLIELNPEYAEIAANRLRAALCTVDAPAFNKAPEVGALFEQEGMA